MLLSQFHLRHLVRKLHETVAIAVFLLPYLKMAHKIKTKKWPCLKWISLLSE
jgi:hypothetical protein